MADIKLIVDYGDVTKATKAVKRLGNATIAASKGQVQSTRASNASKTAINNLGVKVKKGTKLTDDLTSSTKRLTLAQNSSNKALGNTKNKMNGNNMAIQQLGYQFGDFAVQVQGGTSAFVAFSQQGSQLAGILPMIAGPLGLSMGAAVGLSAALGILIPIGSAVGRMFFDMAGEAKTLEEAVGNLESAMGDIDSAVDKLNSLNSNNNLTSASVAMISIAESSKAIAEAQFDLSLVSFIDKLDVTNSKLTTAVEVAKQLGTFFFTPFGDGSILEDMSDESIYSKGFDKLGLSVNKSVYEGARGGLEEALLSGSLEEKLKALKSFQDVLAPTVAIPSSGDGEESRKTKRIPTEKAGKDLLGNVNQMIGLLDLQVSREQSLVDIQATKVSFIKAESTAMDNNLVLLNLEQEQGKKSLSYLFAKDKITLAAYEVQLKGKKLSDKQITDLLEKKRQHLDILSINANSLSIAEDLAKTEEERQKKLDKEDAKAKALLVTQQAILANAIQQGNVVMVTQGLSGRELFVAQEDLKIMAVKQQLKDALLQTDDKIYQNTIKELLSTRELNIASYDRVQAEKLITERIRERAKLQDRINKTVAKATADAEREQKKLADGIANSFGDAFMSMVDGTKSVKDAFRDMARDIIKQLYQILVVEQMVASISGAIQGAMSPSGLGVTDAAPQLRKLANGGVISSGSQVQAYANGGVVNSPTFFGMNGNKTGLMGEAGPEAIMPLKRGSNGKLGVQMEGGNSSQTVVVNQSFNFSANGDDSVKKLIAQAAPQIAKMTKSEIINDRKRGGSMKAAFG